MGPARCAASTNDNTMPVSASQAPRRIRRAVASSVDILVAVLPICRNGVARANARATPVKPALRVGRLLRVEGEGGRRGASLVRVGGRAGQAHLETQDLVGSPVQGA